MIRFDTVSDIFEVAVRLERHSVELYAKLLRSVGTSGARDVFSALAAEEEKHLGQFRVLLEEAAGYEPRYVYPGEYELFIDGTAQRALESFCDVKRASSVRTPLEALALALDMEKAKIAFYSEVAVQFSEKDRSTIERLISEERSHEERIEGLIRERRQGGGEP